MISSPRRSLCPAYLALLLVFPAISLLAQTPTPTPRPSPTPVPSPTPRPTSRPTPTPGPPRSARKFEVSASEVRREPFSLVGRVETALSGEDKVASGAVGSRRVVITAAEVLWSQESGFASRVIFQRGQFGSEVLQRTRATYIVLLSSFTKADDASSRVYSNVGALLFKTAPGQGRSLDLQPTRDYLTAGYQNFMAGYFSNIGDGKKMGGLSEISFRRVQGSLLFRPKNVSKFADLSIGAPVFHGISSGSVFQPVFVGVVVSDGAVRGFSARQIRDLQE